MSVPRYPNVDVGIRCSGCRYDLRSLDVEGRCPECGQLIGESIAAWERRYIPAELEPLWLCGRRFVGRLRDGAAAIVLAFLLIVAAACAPASAYALKTPARRVLLATLSTSFVLQGFGAWRLATTDPILPRSRQRVRRWLRVALLAAYVPWFVLPGRHGASEPVVLAMIVLVVGGALLSTALFYLHVMRLGRRMGSPPIVGLALVMMLLAPLWSFFSLMPRLDGPGDSLSGLIGAPSIPFGSTEALWSLMSDAPTSLVAAAIVPLLGAVTMTWLLVALTLLRRRVETDAPELRSPADAERKTAASSRP